MAKKALATKRPPRPPDERRCTAPSKKQGGERCPNWAMVGLKVCRYHGGNSPRARAKSEVAKEERRLKRIGGGERNIQPADAILEMVRGAAHNVSVLTDEVAALELEVASDGAVALPERTVEFEKGGTVVPARIHILVDMYNSERERLVKWSKVAIDAGIEERRVRLAELDAQRLGQAIGRVLDALEMPTEQKQDFRIKLAGELRKLGGVG